MDELLLTFSKDQYEKYLKIKENPNIELCFDTDFQRINLSSLEIIDTELSKIANESNKLLAIKSSKNVFISFLSPKEIEGLIPVFYTVIGKIDQSRRKLYAESINTSQRLKQADDICNDLYSRYSGFLPYKIALFNNEKYSDQIADIDAEFKSSISLAEEERKNESDLLLRLSNICDVIIPDFFREISQAAGAPKFKDFNDKAFFNAISSFIEKIKI